MNILVRADSSSNIGTGHIMRDLVLVKQYKHSNIIFATQDLNGNINRNITEAKYKVILLKSNDFKELNKIIKSLKIDMLIIDHYGIDYKFEKKLKKKNPQLKILCLDDTYEKHYCDVLLNHNISANSRRYKKLVPKFCELQCGSEYTLLRDEFIVEKNIKYKNKTAKKKILLAIGGSDHSHINIKILKVLKSFVALNIKLTVVTTTANKNLEELKSYVKNKKWINLDINSNKIAKHMRKNDFAIITPSVTANEIYYMDLPFIAIQTASNQYDMFKYMKKESKPVMKVFDIRKLKRMINDRIN